MTIFTLDFLCQSRLKNVLHDECCHIDILSQCIHSFGEANIHVHTAQQSLEAILLWDKFKFDMQRFIFYIAHSQVLKKKRNTHTHTHTHTHTTHSYACK